MNEKDIKRIRNLMDKSSDIRSELESYDLADIEEAIAELDEKIANIENYKTLNGTQSGDMGLEKRNYESNISRIDREIAELTADIDKLSEELANIERKSALQSELDIGAQQSQLTQDESFIDEAYKKADENQKELDNLLAQRKTNEFNLRKKKHELEIKNNERQEVEQLHTAFLHGVEMFQEKDANGNPKFDDKHVPFVPYNFYDLQSDVRTSKELKALRDLLKSRSYSGLQSQINLDPLSTPFKGAQQSQPAPQPQVDPVQQNTQPASQQQVDQLRDEYNERIKKCEYFVTADGEKILLTGFINKQLLISRAFDKAIKFTYGIDELKPTGEVASKEDLECLVDSFIVDGRIKSNAKEILNKMSVQQNTQPDPQPQVDPVQQNTQPDPKPQVDPSQQNNQPDPQQQAAPATSKLITEQYDEEGNLIPAEEVFNKLAKNGEYFMHPTYGKVQAESADTDENGMVWVMTEDENLVEIPLTELSITGKLIDNPIVKKDEKGIKIAVQPANNDTQNSASTNPSSKDNNGNEGDDMSKKDNKIVVTSYSNADDNQKKQAKDKLLTLKKALVSVGIAALTFIALNALTNNNNNNNSEPEMGKATIENDVDTNVNDEVAEKILDDADDHSKAKEEESAPVQAPVQTPVVTPAPTPAPASTELTQPEAQSLYPEFYTDHLNPYTGEAVAPTHVEEHQTSQDPTPEQNQQAINQINNGAGVGTTLANGQTILSQSTSITGGELQGITTTVVDDHQVTPEGITNNNTNNNSNTNSNTNTNTNTSSSSSSSSSTAASSTSSNSQTTTNTTTTTTTETVTLHNGESLGSYTNDTGKDQQVEVTTEIVDEEVLPVLDADTLSYFDADGIEHETGGMHR